jgi:hypothetical protein
VGVSRWLIGRFYNLPLAGCGICGMRPAQRKERSSDTSRGFGYMADALSGRVHVAMANCLGLKLRMHSGDVKNLHLSCDAARFSG